MGQAVAIIGFNKNSEKAQSMEKAIRAAGQSAWSAQVDVTSPKSVREFFEFACSAAGRVGHIVSVTGPPSSLKQDTGGSADGRRSVFPESASPPVCRHVDAHVQARGRPRRTDADCRSYIGSHHLTFFNDTGAFNPATEVVDASIAYTFDTGRGETTVSLWALNLKKDDS